MVSEKLFLISKRIYDESDYGVSILSLTLKNLGDTYLLSFFSFHLRSTILTTAVTICNFASAAFTKVHGDSPSQFSIFRIYV